MIFIMLIVSCVYLVLIACFIYGFDKIEPFHLKDLSSKTKFSVVVPFRNEENKLTPLLQSINTLNYPKHMYEIIFVDDDSSDSSVELITIFKTDHNIQDIKIIKNERVSNSPKKDAITTAINKAKFDWIVTTDADCKLPKYWLESFDEYIQKFDVKCIAAPITYQVKPSMLDQFQLLDILSLQGATIGGFGIGKPFLCNGANFAYQKKLFKTLNGFKNNDTIASGDDIFFLEKVVRAYPKQTHYLKCEQAIVVTSPENSWQRLISQRKRWASKIGAYNTLFGKLTGFIVLLMNASIICALMLTFLGLIPWQTLAYILVIKCSIDFLLIYKMASFLNQRIGFKSYFIGCLVYPFFIVYVAFASMFSGFKWKDRAYGK